jgi:hypothetical protein
MKTIETDDRYPRWVNAFLNWLAMPVERVVPLFSVQWGMGTMDRPNLRNYRVTRGLAVVAESTRAPYDASARTPTLVRNWTHQSLFYNGVVYLRVLKPFGIFFLARTRKRILYLSLGWKLNGRATIGFRIQTDASAAAGDQGPNYGQAPGFMDGTK